MLLSIVLCWVHWFMPKLIGGNLRIRIVYDQCNNEFNQIYNYVSKDGRRLKSSLVLTCIQSHSVRFFFVNFNLYFENVNSFENGKKQFFLMYKFVFKAIGFYVIDLKILIFDIDKKFWIRFSCVQIDDV